MEGGGGSSTRMILSSHGDVRYFRVKQFKYCSLKCIGMIWKYENKRPLLVEEEMSDSAFPVKTPENLKVFK